MDYMQRKLAQRLVTDPGHTNIRAEEQLFYDSFGAAPGAWVKIRKKLLDWHATRPATPARTFLRKATG